MGDSVLTPEELRVIDMLVDVTAAFNALPEHHPSEQFEWVLSLHQMQRQVMARVARRAHPEYFTSMVPLSGVVA